MSRKNVPASIDSHWPEGDAETLARAHEIQSDPKRLAAAQKAAGEIAQKRMDEVSHMHHVAHGPDGGQVKGKKTGATGEMPIKIV